MFELFNKSWSQYGNFNGRASRREFWNFYFFYIVIMFLSGFIGGLSGFENLSGLVFVAMIVPLLSCGARRMHDVGKSGWFQIVPIYNLFLLVQPSLSNPKEGNL